MKTGAHKCPRCDGYGNICEYVPSGASTMGSMHYLKCPTCQGKGYITAVDNLVEMQSRITDLEDRVALLEKLLEKYNARVGE